MDTELLQAIVSNDDNLSYGSIISVYTGDDESVTALTDNGMDELEQMLNSQSGWSAIAGGGPDMQQLLASRNRGDIQAKLGVDLYVTAIRKTIGAYAALMSGIDLLVFTGGIGQNSEEIRTLVCAGLEFLGFSEESNGSRVLAIRTEEERQIARICRRLSRPHT